MRFRQRRRAATIEVARLECRLEPDAIADVELAALEEDEQSAAGMLPTYSAWEVAIRACVGFAAAVAAGIARMDERAAKWERPAEGILRGVAAERSGAEMVDRMHPETLEAEVTVTVRIFSVDGFDGLRIHSDVSDAADAATYLRALAAMRRYVESIGWGSLLQLNLTFLANHPEDVGCMSDDELAALPEQVWKAVENLMHADDDSLLGD